MVNKRFLGFLGPSVQEVRVSGLPYNHGGKSKADYNQGYKETITSTTYNQSYSLPIK